MRRQRARALALLVVAATATVLALPTIKRIVRDITLPLDYASVIREQAREKHLDPALIAAVIYAETKFDARTSPTGALGLMQIEPATAEFLAHRSGERPSRSPTSPSRRSTSATAPTTSVICSISTAATRHSRWPPTTAARRTSTTGLPGHTPPA